MRIPKTLALLSLLFTFALTASVFPQDSVPQWTVEEVAQSVEQLWQGYDPRKEELNVKNVRSWKQDGVNVHYVVYTVGRFRGKDSTVAAFYTTPLDTTKKYPAVVKSTVVDNVPIFGAVLSMLSEGTAVSLRIGADVKWRLPNQMT